MSDQLRLHIGGKEINPDWKILDVEERPELDYVSILRTAQKLTFLRKNMRT